MEKTLIPQGTLLHGAGEVSDRPGGRTDRGAKLISPFSRFEANGEFYDVTATVVGGSQDLETGIGGVVGAVIGERRRPRASPSAARERSSRPKERT
jgi:hypothetical protein